MDIKIIDFGIEDYESILSLQTSYFQKLLENKKNRKEGNEYILIGEHYPVITKGRRADDGNILMPESMLEKEGVKIYATGRGGDVTFHGPGQMIVYPILDLDKHSLGLKQYVDLLEESVIRLLESYGIKGERIEGATGVWIGKGEAEERKICAMGLKCSRFCTMHGLALNINTDLKHFSYINPCGFKDKGVTSMEKELVNALPIENIKKEYLHILLSLIFPFEEVFDFAE